MTFTLYNKQFPVCVSYYIPTITYLAQASYTLIPSGLARPSNPS